MSQATALSERPQANIIAVGPTAVTADQMDLVRKTVANGATADELKLYLYDCQRQGVHPLDKLIHFTKRNGKYTPITSIDFMRTRAADTGEYAGSDDAMFALTGDGSYPEAATVTVWRMVQSQRCSFTATARWSEYKPAANDFMWQKMPHTMLAKCAEALALRKGFPRQLAGLYAKEEMDQAGPSVVAPEPPKAIVDVATGAQVPADQPKPPVPVGFAYLDSCAKSGQWWNVVWNGETFKTKQEQIGASAEQAYQDGVPVKCHSKKQPWLDRVERYADHGEKVSDDFGSDSIPF